MSEQSNLIDGVAIAKTIREEIKGEVSAIVAAHGKAPGLAVVLIGDRKDSATYVRMKKRACEEVGIESIEVTRGADISQEELVGIVRELNADERVHGILIQLPLPAHINEEAVLQEVSLQKDVDGFHPVNIGRLAMKGRDPLFVPCTPKGCIELLDRMGVAIAGKRAVVLGRSNIVGIPVAMLLLQRDATVTICHSRTKDLPAVVREADILVAAVGRANMVRGDWIKPGAVVIDVGINSVDDPSDKRGYRLVGDCLFEEVREQASLVTPVPGGVGPMTIAMLLQNTLASAKRHLGAAGK